jgi:hypothetical protein
MTFYKDLVTLESDVIRLLNDQIDISIIAKYLSYVITGNTDSKYNQDLESMLKLDCSFMENYGLTNLLLKMTSENTQTLEPEIDQLVTPIPNFNLTFKRQTRLHPNVDFLHSTLLPFHNKESDIMLDLYLDDTFGINSDVYKILSIIPYVHDWYGFIYDTKGIFDNDDFIESLKYCKGLFVFSNFSKKIVERSLSIWKIDVKVFRFFFPVSQQITNFKCFKGDIFFGSTSPIIETSDVFSFYNTRFKLKSRHWFKECSRPLGKYVLNPLADEVPEDRVLYKINNTLINRNWSNSLIRYLSQSINSVQILNDEIEIDEFLSENIVFCNIIKGSVMVVLNQCITRSTPIIINKHPVAVELLGADYPLYHSGENEIVLTDAKIKKAHKYLVKLNKTKLRNKFQINTFIATLNSVIG